jgi:hypothetical protein
MPSSPASTGDPAEGERIVVPLKSFGTSDRRHADAAPVRADAGAARCLCSRKGRRYYWKSEYLSEACPSLCSSGFIAHAARIRSPHSAVILFQIGGALNELALDHSPVGNRDGTYVLNITGSWEKPEDDAATIEWARGAWNDMREFSTGGTYINFLTEDEGPERTAAALGSHIQRLAEVKARWDPENVFRTNRNIEPAASAAG